MELFAFDEAYLRRLIANDRMTTEHFASYFTELLRIKLRNRLLNVQDIDDVLQETLVRVLAQLRQNGQLIQHPERLGAYVNAICNNVLAENYRNESRNRHVDWDTVEVTDPQSDIEETAFQKERQVSVYSVLRELSVKERAILCAHLLQEEDTEEICRMFGVDRDYLRVLLHRARVAFRATVRQRAINPSKRSRVHEN